MRAAFPRSEPVTAAAPPASAVAAPYERYFATGHYDRRYPRPNRRVLRLIRSHLPPRGHVVDFGCGSGRYLLALRDRAGMGAGFDICTAALARFDARIGALGTYDSLRALGPDPAELSRHLERHGPADVALCLFGVLAHMEDAAQRRATLRRLASLLKPGSGRLIISVPNRLRRFRREQRGQGDLIHYVRALGGEHVELPYQLFDPRSFAVELAGGGFAIDGIHAESLLPETAIAKSPALAAVDALLAPLLPAALGYGLLAVARPVAGAS